MPRGPDISSPEDAQGLLHDQHSYQTRDGRIVDYQFYTCDKVRATLRGPRPKALRPLAYAVCLGAAQTMGVLCERPYPAILEETLGLPVVNLGLGGASPSLFTGNDGALAIVNEAKFVIVQIMSGRSESNSLYASAGTELLTRRSDGGAIRAVDAYDELLKSHALATLNFGGMRRFLIPHAPKRLRAVISQTRAAWMDSHRALLEEISVPTVLFWFSSRTPQYKERYHTVQQLFGQYPQLVNAEMVDAVKPAATHYVECVSGRGMPQPLRDKDTGAPASINLPTPAGAPQRVWTHNPYYPSPEMHEDAAAALAPVCTGLAG